MYKRFWKETAAMLNLLNSHDASEQFDVENKF